MHIYTTVVFTIGKKLPRETLVGLLKVVDRVDVLGSYQYAVRMKHPVDVIGTEYAASKDFGLLDAISLLWSKTYTFLLDQNEEWTPTVLRMESHRSDTPAKEHILEW